MYKVFLILKKVINHKQFEMPKGTRFMQYTINQFCLDFPNQTCEKHEAFCVFLPEGNFSELM